MRSRSNSYGKRKLKVNEDDFYVLRPCQHIDFLSFDFNVKQLKMMLKTYGLKLSGNKNELTNRIYEFMKRTYFAIMIQTQFRRYVMTKFMKIRSHTRYSTLLNYNNDTDFYTMENIESIPDVELYSYTDEQHFNYVFKISSLLKHFQSQQKSNPYNRDPFPSIVYKNVQYIWKVYKMYGIHVDDEEVEDLEPLLSRQQRIQFKITSLFQKIDALGNYTNINWMLNLTKRELVKFIKELHDIWQYRAQLPIETKIQICPPSGTPFLGIPVQTLNRHQHHMYLLETCTEILDRFLNNSASDSNKSLGALYILSALTLVSRDAADALPWLYQSVATQF